MIQRIRIRTDEQTARPPRKQGRPYWMRPRPEAQKVALLIAYRCAYYEHVMADMPRYAISRAAVVTGTGAAKGQGV